MTTAALILICLASLFGLVQVTRDFAEAWPRLVKLMKGDR
jgi:hypothetical protein